MNGLRGFRSECILKVGSTSPWTDTGLLLDQAIAAAATDVTDQLRLFFLLIQMSAFLYNCTLPGSLRPLNVTYLI